MKQYQIDGYKQGYPPGTPVELISMEDANAVPPGTKGVVDFVDDIGTIHVTWENGRSLGVCPDVDRLRRVDAPAVDKEAGLRDRLQTAAKAAGEKSAPGPKPRDSGER